MVALERCLAALSGLTSSRASTLALSMCTKEAGLTMLTCTEPAPSTMCFSCHAGYPCQTSTAKGMQKSNCCSLTGGHGLVTASRQVIGCAEPEVPRLCYVGHAWSCLKLNNLFSSKVLK